MLKIAVLASGGGTNFQAILDKIQDGYLRCEIVKLIASREDAYAIERAKKNHIPWEVIRRKNYADQESFSTALIASVKESGAQLVVLAGYLTILGEQFVKEYEGRIMNIHPSLIPSFCGKGYYGLKVHREALRAGVKITGATVHFVDENADTGPIILQKAVNVMEDDTAEVLQRRVMTEAEWVLLPQAIKLFSENRIYIENNKVRIKEAQE